MKAKTIIYTIVVLVIFIGLFFFLRPKSLRQTQTTTAAPSQPEKTFEISVKDRKIASGPATLEASEGDKVTIKMIVDEADELHLHGYDKSVDLEKDAEGQLVFTANLTGRFPFELENSKTELGVLEVMPK